MNANSESINGREPVVLFDTSDGPLRGRSPDEFIAVLRDALSRNALSGKVKEAHLFGSVAVGNYKSTSDVDLLLVVDTQRNFFERYLDFPEIFELTHGLDLLIYTPSEFEKKKQEGGCGFWASLFKDAKRII